MAIIHKEFMETPTASLSVSANGTYNVVDKASAVVSVPLAEPIEVSTDQGMADALTTANIGKAFKFTGTTGTYTNGDIYIIEEVV